MALLLRPSDLHAWGAKQGQSEREPNLKKRDIPARLFQGDCQLLTSMGQTALVGGGSSTTIPQALYSDLSYPKALEELLSAPPPDRGAQRYHGGTQGLLKEHRGQGRGVVL